MAITNSNSDATRQQVLGQRNAADSLCGIAFETSICRWTMLTVVALAAFSVEVGYADSRFAASTRMTSASITRDRWGVAHIHGRTHADAFFGMGYAQAEDYFWQLEDTCIQSLGRYAEINGQDGIRSDILNRSFEIPRRSREDFQELKPEYQRMATAYADGINYYLKTHPEEKPRLISRFEPWYSIAMDRHMLLHFIYRQVHVGKPQDRGPDDVALWSSAQSGMNSFAWDWQPLPKTGFAAEVREAVGSNAWAISGSRTKSGAAMLFINPHQPWYGIGQFTEAHIRSDEGLNFSGACFFGNPFPTIGHNEHLGWTYTVNAPDIADAWRVTFDDPDHPLNYRYGDGYREAQQWKETLRVKSHGTMTERQFTFRKTHHGPIVRRESDDTFLSAQVAGLFDLNRIHQALSMVLAQSFEEWRAAISHCAIPMFNVVYADNSNNIFYAYNATIPVRDPSFNWRQPVDGSRPAADWKGIHPFDDLPQVLNPQCGYVQSCNSAPFTTCHLESDNPSRDDFPSYMMEDAEVDMRRSKMSRHILKDVEDLTYGGLQQLAFDTRMYWALTELPKLKGDYDRLKREDSVLASEIGEYWEYLQNWDYRCTIEGAHATLMVAWYEELYGFGYPAETLKSQYASDRLSWFTALKKAADKLKSLYGTWKKPWGEAHRLQRVADQPDVQHAGIRLNPIFENIPCPGAPGPLGIICTVYSSPEIRFIRPQRFAVVGASYMSVVEFDHHIRAASIMPFGASGRRQSPHFFDQARLYSQKKLKPAVFYMDEVQSAKARVVQIRTHLEK
ncbi:MAG: penicillin acylase family protein [Fuerstiella sp.]|nr:penicillin acylase family protein [Fuerstiella sp.]